MRFPRIEYIEWIGGRPAAATHDLGTTGLCGRHDDPIVDPDRELATDEPVESLLAAEYGVDGESVVVTAGATEANFLALATALPEEGRILVERPGYEAHWATPRGLGATVDRFERPPTDSFALEPDRIREAVRPSTDAVVVTNRHNPSGHLADRDTLREAAAAAGNARLLVDEVYAPYVEPPRTDGAFGGPTGAGLEDVVVTGSLTKFLGYRDLRIGWLIADPAFAQRARATAAHLGSPSTLSRQYAASILAADRPARPPTEMETSAGGERPAARALYSDHVARLESFLQERSDLSAPEVRPCSYTFPAHERASGTDVATEAADAGILVVPGRFFGDDRRFRLGLGRTASEMDEALEALGRVLDDV